MYYEHVLLKMSSDSQTIYIKLRMEFFACSPYVSVVMATDRRVVKRLYRNPNDFMKKIVTFSL